MEEGILPRKLAFSCRRGDAQGVRYEDRVTPR